ncbi:hypothetical protein Thert_01311 [Thermoanaerobacterium thermosaccharolyticum]|uniref:Uncharacterized protein n=1 Tax=Thermoanaerobacterium thermosaccharolyticum TaxID=1517 RepID=A0A223HY33_THETR|nr:hypothetical protein Thert_01311 [Thermoanaerobacterium thermosaccharolyticum]
MLKQNTVSIPLKIEKECAGSLGYDTVSHPLKIAQNIKT